MPPRKNDLFEALFIVEWYACALSDALIAKDGARDDAFFDVVELLKKSALSAKAQAAVVRVVLCVMRLEESARTAMNEDAREGAKAASLRAAQVATVAAAVVLFVASLLFRWERAALVAFLCCVGAVAPVLFAKLIQATQGKGD